MQKNEDIEDIVDMMDAVMEDRSVPRNIRAAVDEAKRKVLDEKEDFGVRITAAIYVLDDISNDINMPAHTRTEIWGIISKLEHAGESNK